MPPRKRPSPKPAKPKPKPKPRATRTFRASGRTVAVRESRSRVTIAIDGNDIPGVAKLADGQFHSEFLPFRGYATADELGRALAAHAGSTYVLGDGGPHSRGGAHTGAATKRATRGHS